MEPLEKLEDMANGVRSYLGKVFRFQYADGDVNAYLGDASRISCMKALLVMEKLRGAPESEVKKEMEHLSRPNTGTCLYMGDIFPDIDYAVFVRGISEATPIVLGEEITHGEHTTEHIRRLGSLAGYDKEFGSAAPEFLGYLGMHSMAKKLASAGNSVTLGVSNPIDDAHRSGYTYASRLIGSGKDIPYPDIFHARNKQEMWDIIKDITGP